VDGVIRRLTPLECERLQAYPDHWTAIGTVENEHGFNTAVRISDAQRYKTLGNGVTTNVVEAIMERIFAKNTK
jgi:Site-specific DNA methylase